MKKNYYVVSISTLLVMSTIVGCGVSGATKSNGSNAASATKSGVITLKAVSAWPKSTPDNAGLFDLIKKVNALGKGKVHIEYLGGPSVIPTMQQPDALKSGTMDIDWTSAGYTSSLVPAANALKLSTLTPQQERSQGVTKLWNTIFKQMNARFLCRGAGSPKVSFHLYTTKPVKSLSDFKGLPMRTSPAYKNFLTALGAAPVSLPPGQVYTALQRGVVKGYGWPGYGIHNFGWDKLTKYMIDPGFYQVDDIALMNLKTWNSLPKNIQAIFNKADVQVEQDMKKHFLQLQKKDVASMQKKGVKVIHLSSQQSKTYTKLAYSSAWNSSLTAP
ncbi:TRAP transporter substrate-binding protein DctP [Alicyclobacillus sp. SO9]|uniref:TRAP transporter substrate-binding protein DctP n=1 Tax=Alicyclobacillus sp. SO9 TaxID=2665646 RepID=UPI0018E73B4E|nr:TRAP transporter substrate-binding protein DctP [Alicyclobacillus sp. SO9]QQE78183.1 TRAP transporter substrate-binding protein DctP [Alicyclobacillus sp. SO9]